MWIHTIHGHLCLEKFRLWHCSSAAKNQGALCRGPRPPPLTRDGGELGPDSAFPSAAKALRKPLPRTLCLHSWSMAGKADAIDGELSVEGIYYTRSSSTEPVNLSPLPRRGWRSAGVKMHRLKYEWGPSPAKHAFAEAAEANAIQTSLGSHSSCPDLSPILCWRGKVNVWAPPWRGPAHPYHRDALKPLSERQSPQIRTHHTHPSNDQNGTQWVLKSYSGAKKAQKPLITNGIVSLREKSLALKPS